MFFELASSVEARKINRLSATPTVTLEAYTAK